MIIEVRHGLAVGLWEMKTPKFAVHTGGSGHDGGEKRNVLAVSVLLHISIDLALRSETQGQVDVLRDRQVAILQGVAATPITVVHDAEVEDQAARLVLKVVPDLYVTAPLACACRDCWVHTSKPSVVHTNVSHSGWSQALLAVVALSFPSHYKCFQFRSRSTVAFCF